MTAQIDVQIATEDASVPVADDLAKWVSRAIVSAGRSPDAEVSVRVVESKEMQRLNCEFRGQDKPTNVLSFPAGEIDGLPEDTEMPLGDIVVCAAVVTDEAAQQGKKTGDHWAHART